MTKPPGERRCRWCHNRIDNHAPVNAAGSLRLAHCRNPQCSWCLVCQHRREAALAAGKPELLDNPGD